MDKLLDRIESLANLKEDWDSYGSCKISPLAIIAAKRIATGWQAVPMNGGGVQLEIHVPGGEIEIGPDGKVAWAGAFDENNNVILEK